MHLAWATHWATPQVSPQPALTTTCCAYSALYDNRFLHLRAAAADFLELVSQHANSMPRGGVVHSFDGSAEEAAAVLAQPGLAIGVPHQSGGTGPLHALQSV